MNQVLQPHESHIPFPLQFMIDYNLFGMHHIHLSAVKFRVSGGLGTIFCQNLMLIAQLAVWLYLYSTDFP